MYAAARLPAGSRLFTSTPRHCGALFHIEYNMYSLSLSIYIYMFSSIR